jgi:23S rRNA-/tRNA-specific pseudouridylate synthase
VSEDDFWAALPLGRGVTLLNRDRAGLAALSKPAGILSHPNRPGEESRSLLAAPYDLEGEFYHWPAAPGGPARRLWLLNRLDSATSGVILVAAGGPLADGIRAQFKQKQVKKVYVALVFGRPVRASEVWRDRLAVAKRQGVVRTGAGPIPAESRMSLLRTAAGPPPLSLLRLEPRTGRSHQLRVQCADRHLPIVGDQTYGDFRRNRDFARRAGTERLFLHSFETAFTYQVNGRSRPFQARAPLPPEFEAVLG